MFTFILFIGLLLFTLGTWYFLQSFSFVKKGMKTTGTVVAVEESVDSEGDTSYKPIFHFTAHDNTQQVFEGSTTGRSQSWYEGDVAIIVYDPDNPGRAKLFSYFGSFGIAIFLLMSSMPPMVIGFGYFAFEVLIR